MSRFHPYFIQIADVDFTVVDAGTGCRHMSFNWRENWNRYFLYTWNWKRRFRKRTPSPSWVWRLRRIQRISRMAKARGSGKIKWTVRWPECKNNTDRDRLVALLSVWHGNVTSICRIRRAHIHLCNCPLTQGPLMNCTCYLTRLTVASCCLLWLVSSAQSYKFSLHL